MLANKTTARTSRDTHMTIGTSSVDRGVMSSRAAKPGFYMCPWMCPAGAAPMSRPGEQAPNAGRTGVKARRAGLRPRRRPVPEPNREDSERSGLHVCPALASRGQFPFSTPRQMRRELLRTARRPAVPSSFVSAADPGCLSNLSNDVVAAYVLLIESLPSERWPLLTLIGP